MNRLRFFSEMKKGMLDTVKAVCEPFLDEKIEQMDRAADSILQMDWVLLTEDIELIHNIEQRFINGINILVFRTGGNIQAVSGICPVCFNLLCFSESTKELKCFTCEKQYSLLKEEGQLALTFFPIRKRDNRYEIGMKNDS